MSAAYPCILNENLIHNSGVTSADAKLAFHIYGKDPAAVMGKTRRQNPLVVPIFLFVSLPDSILKLHKDVTIFIDVFLINGNRFFHSISDSIKMRTVESLTNGYEATLAQCSNRVINRYQSCGFQVVEIRGDGQFKCIEEHIRPTHIYT